MSAVTAQHVPSLLATLRALYAAELADLMEVAAAQGHASALHATGDAADAIRVRRDAIANLGRLYARTMGSVVPWYVEPSCEACDGTGRTGCDRDGNECQSSSCRACAKCSRSAPQATT